MKIIGSHGLIEWDYYQNSAKLIVEGKMAEESVLPPEWERNNLFISIMNDFLESITEARTPRVTLEDGIETLKIALAIKAKIASQMGK